MKCRRLRIVTVTTMLIGTAFPLHARDWPTYRDDVAPTVDWRRN